MTGRPAYDRATYLEDIKALRARGLSVAAIALELGIARTTVYRILQEAQK